ncbi:membrane protein [Mycolicibacterium sp. TY81]|nr:membrane protein [Mycolicibacterium sp. TY81]
MSVASNVVVGVNAVFFAGMGLRALTAPAEMLRPFGITLGGPASRAEVRAVYGGFGLAIAAILGYAIAAPEQVRTGIVVTVSVALLGMAFGRIVSAVAGDRTPFYPNWFYGFAEVLLAASLWWAG